MKILTISSFLILILMFKAYITVSLALIIEASLEAYFQFWLQSNFSLPDILSIEITDLKQLVNHKTFSILISFITISVSIVKIRYNFEYKNCCQFFF